MSMELIILLCAIYAIGIIATAAVLHAKGVDDGPPDMGIGMLALFWPMYLVLIIVGYSVSWLGYWVAKIGGWR